MIKPFDYQKILSGFEEEITDVLVRVLHSGNLILGPETTAFETEFATYVGARHCIGTASGTAALHLALLALGIGPGDEVITVSNTCVPTVAAIWLCGATPVFVDVSDNDLMMDPSTLEPAITEKTKCILPVHLWGQGVDIEALARIAEKHGLSMLEDCAQASGTTCNGRHAGTFGHAGCFSFYPTKNLGAYGDAGAVVTNDTELAAKLKRIRMYGYDESGVSVEPGMNARISEMQAAVLRVKLRRLDGWIQRRREIAGMYDKGIGAEGIELPFRHEGREHSFHQYVIRSRERAVIINRLKAAGIGFGIHYPVPVHLMPAYRQFSVSPLPVTERAASEILSVPMHEALSDEEVETVIRVLNDGQ